MKYKVLYDIFVFFFLVLASGYFIYIGIRQIRKVPFIIKGFSTKAVRAIPGIMIFSTNAINEEFNGPYLVPALCFISLFFIFLYIDYKKYYILYIYNIEEEKLSEVLQEYLKAKDIQFEIIDSPTLVDSLYNEVRIYKSKSIKNIRNIIRDFEMHISQRKYKKFRVMGLVNILFGVGLLIFAIHIYIKFHM